jgi:DNA-binding response OmpR family regulator
MQPHLLPVLIVEDDFSMRYVLGRLIHLTGRRTVGASTVADALSLLETEPETVVIDLNLPDGNGEVVLRAVRERFLTCRVVVCSGVADQERLEQVKGLHPDAILTKPFLADEFLSACRGASRKADSRLEFPRDSPSERR